VLLLLAAVLQGAPLPLARLPWLVLALVGVGLSSGLLEQAATGTAQGAWQGMVLALLAASLYAVATLTTQQLSRIAPAQIAMLQMLAGALALLPGVWALRGQAVFSPRPGARWRCWAWCTRPGCTR